MATISDKSRVNLSHTIITPSLEWTLTLPGPWTVCQKPKPAAGCRLFCLPYAGGNSGTYRSWDSLLPDSIELHTIQLPGRLRRFSEAPLLSVADIVAQCTPQLSKLIVGKPYALFGHSMGAVVAFELGRELRRMGRPPRWLFASGRQAPQLPWRRPVIHGLDEASFRRALGQLGGTPEAVLAHPELMAALMPVLRADFTAIETYRCSPQQPLDCPITLFGGLTDPHVSVDDLLAWQDQTSARAMLTMLQGGHFFIEEEAPAIVRTIITDLNHA